MRFKSQQLFTNIYISNRFHFCLIRLLATPKSTNQQLLLVKEKEPAETRASKIQKESLSHLFDAHFSFPLTPFDAAAVTLWRPRLENAIQSKDVLKLREVLPKALTLEVPNSFFGANCGG